MNPSTIQQDVADAVIATLVAATAGTFSVAFTPTRTYDDTVVLESLATLRVDVYCEPATVERMTRGEFAVTCPVTIIVRKQAAISDTAAIDALAVLLGEIWDYLTNNSGQPRALTGYAEANLDESDDGDYVAYIPDILRQQAQYVGFCTLRYKVQAA